MKRLVIVGAGHRCYTNYATALTQKYADKWDLCGVCDTNIGRCEYFRDTLRSDLAVYTDFELMMSEQQPDAVLVTTPDCYHHEYIIRALDLGCNVYSEKPLTIDVEKCRAIREAEKRSGKQVTVTFNCRFMPYFAALKKIISSGKIGKPLSIHYEYVLNTVHGGDYFKRWHRFIDISGGMMVHKATHHFDIINWLLEDDPISVCAQGARLYYGNTEKSHSSRCSTCPNAYKCPSFEDFQNNDLIRSLYFDNEDKDGYIRDHCAFLADTDIYDSMSVSVAYKKGALLTYSLNLFNTREGFTINVIGEDGRLEFSTFSPENVIRMRDGSVEPIDYTKSSGAHAGGDERMLDMLFGNATDDPLGQCANSFDGIKSVMIGAAANESIKKAGQTINLSGILEQMR